MSSFVVHPSQVYGLNRVSPNLVSVDLVGSGTDWMNELDEAFDVVSGPLVLRSINVVDDTHATLSFETGATAGPAVISDGHSQATIVLGAIEPTGPIALPLANLQELVAASATFQAWVGAADAGAAISRVHIVDLPPPGSGKEYTAEELAALRPFGIVNLFSLGDRPGLQPFLATKLGDITFQNSVKLVLSLEADVNPTNDAATAELTFLNNVGAIVEEILALAGTDDYLTIHKLEMLITAIRSDQTEIATQGDRFKTVLLIEAGIEVIRGVIQYVRSPEVTAREFKNGVALANSEAVEAWREKFVPLHFTPEAFDRYGYQPRKGQLEPEFIQKTFGAGLLKRKQITRTIKNPKYFWAKFHAGWGKLALVKTGASARAAMRGAFKITSSVNRATGVFQGLDRYFYQYRTDTAQPIDKAAELVAITESEINTLVIVHQLSVETYLESIKTPSEVAA